MQGDIDMHTIYIDPERTFPYFDKPQVLASRRFCVN